MKVADKIRSLPAKMKKQLKTAVLITCALATFIVPAFGDGYSILKPEDIQSNAAAIEDVDIGLVGASAFGEARKAMNATDPDLKDYFVENSRKLVGSKWQNIGLFVGPRDALSGTVWSAYLSPVTLTTSEVETYADSFKTAYEKYKAFGYAFQILNHNAMASNTSAVSINEGLDSMSEAAMKLGSFGVEFLSDYNPGPVLLSLYDVSYLGTYSGNKLVQLVNNNDVLYNIVSLFGSKVGGTGLSFFVLLNAVLAVFGLALSMLLTLFGNRQVGDGIRGFLVRVVIGTVGIYVVANFLSISLKWVEETVADIEGSATATYLQTNLNVYEWYQCGFAIPYGRHITIDQSGQFVFTREDVEVMNRYIYKRLYGDADDETIQAHMESLVQGNNVGTASIITPSTTTVDAGGEETGEAWATDVYYALMDNFAQNKEDIMDDGGNPDSPLKDKTYSILLSKYLWMSYMGININGDGTYTVNGQNSSSTYGLNPISALNVVRTNFAGDSISTTYNSQPQLAYVAYNVTNGMDMTGDNHMNSITRFIACFTMILAAMKGLVTIWTSAFAGVLAGGAKTATGSAHGLGQAIGGVIALIFGTIGISVIMSMSLSLLDTVYGIAKGLLTGTELIDTFLQPVQDAVGGIPIIGPSVMAIASNAIELVLSLILALTFPKLGGIPVTVFAQYMSEIPSRIAERAHMIEGMLMAGRMGGHGGLPPRGGGGRPGASGQMARNMANQAFSNGARQAAAVMSAGAHMAGALAGASLATAGSKLADKADAMEGKPDNPGLDNWDDYTPEEQAAIAAAAANDEGWEDKSQEERQQFAQDAVNNANAEPNTSGNQEQNSQDTETPTEHEAPVEAKDGTEVPTADGVNGKDGVNGVVPNGPVSDNQGTREQSMNPISTGDGKAPDGTAEAPTEGSGDEEGVVDSETIETVEEKDFSDNSQTLNPTADVDNTLDVDEVDGSLNSTEEKLTQEQMDAITQQNSSELKNANYNGGNLTQNAGDTTSSLDQHAGDTKKDTTFGGGNFQTNTANVRTANEINAQQSALNNQYNGGDISSETKNVSGAQGKNGNAKPGAGSQKSVSSKWGKEMTVKEQKNARLVRTVGHTMQAMGGNRTMGQGVKEAMGYAKDMAVAYTVPIELQNAESHPLMGSLHQRRVADQKKKQEQQQQKNRQK